MAVTTNQRLTGVSLPSPYILGQSGMPMILPSSGTIGANGALTLTTGLPATYPNAYMFFPAGAINTGSTAGMYYVEMTSITVGTIFNNIYISGMPTIPTKVPFSGTTGVAYTQTTAADISLVSITIPANSLGNNGEFRVASWFGFPNTANTKTIKILATASGTTTTLTNRARTTTTLDGVQGSVINEGQANRNVNIFTNTNTDQIAATSNPQVRTAIDTSADLVIAFVAQLSVATDFVFATRNQVLVSPS